MGIQIRRAIRHKKRARVALQGATGSGKTYSALRMARGLAGPEGMIVVLDTEHSSAELFADVAEFDVIDMAELGPFTPDNYVAAIRAAEKAGAAVIIVDSLSHAWKACLDEVDRLGNKNKLGQFGAWAVVGAKWDGMLQAILSSSAHVIATMRAKAVYLVEETERDGRKGTSISKVGTTAVAREDVGYEFDLALLLDGNHYPTVDKTRWDGVGRALGPLIDEQFGEDLAAWLGSGAERPPAPTLLERVAAAAGYKELSDMIGEVLDAPEGPVSAEAAGLLVERVCGAVVERMPAAGYEPGKLHTLEEFFGRLGAVAFAHGLDDGPIEAARVAVGLPPMAPPAPAPASEDVEPAGLPGMGAAAVVLSAGADVVILSPAEQEDTA